ncbi:hypothetical protein [Erwinia sorbitola]|uniref:Ribbon-helix-helix protein, CopG family n=1 Tax=Erwinia sorbitola TaxID=2681984 RepID=A0A6I6ENM1_9GAMM|nr:hypothetical protein [Erwinia sorbitola]MTD25554.1 hypothetical protein [Erwinia sorbitola]QGU87886.1 hypothetical protein GN242_11900 [Erwinia sorbitola]
MTDKVSLTIKIDPALKETIKALALESQLSLSDLVTQHLVQSFSAQAPGAVDNTNTEEETSEQLTQAELKQIRALLKKSKKKK